MTFLPRLQPQRRDVRTPPVWSDHSLGYWHPDLAFHSHGLDVPVRILTSASPVPCALPLVSHLVIPGFHMR
jgi:hypothetical protein